VRAKLSAVVVSYNRATLIGTCLRALGFADEVIVVDKSSTDNTALIAARHADRVITVPWSPTVEETRAFAVAQCEYEWIICLDDDECLSPEAIRFIQAELDAPRADVYGLLLRHYIIGTHDEGAYYWPEHQIRLFRRGAVTFSGTVHGGAEVHSDSVFRLPPDSGVAIHHLSHLDVAQWVEKTNRYTSRVDRERVSDDGRSLIRFARERIDYWKSRTRDLSPGGYPEAVCVLRATYDLIDRLKVWEEERGLDAAAEFARVCASLDARYQALGTARDRRGETWTAAPYSPRAVDEHEVLRRRLAHLRGRYDALTVERDTLTVELTVERDANAAEAARLASELAALETRHHESLRSIEAERLRAERAEAEFSGAQTEAIAQQQRAEQAEVRLASLQHELGVLRGEHDALWRAHDVLQGSLRTFLRVYLPRLRRHILGQRP
jgi:glycosyltransferase involved in cell wall biosynthesis